MPTNDNELLLTILDYLIQFVSIAVIFFLTIRFIDKKRGIRRPKVLWLIGLFLLTTSLYDLLNFIDYDLYAGMFLELPQWLINVRYAFSVLLRCFTIFLALGVLYFNEQARRFLIAIAIFTIVTIYWKHPYSVFVNTAISAEGAWGLDTSQGLNFPGFPWICMFVYVTADILISGITIYCLTLPNIKALFKK